MANYASLKAAIQQVVKTNGNNEITGALLQQSLLAMINSLGGYYQFAGIANPSTDPGTPDQNVFYLASVAGTYPNFGDLAVVNGKFVAFLYNGTWTKYELDWVSLATMQEVEKDFAPRPSAVKFIGLQPTTTTLIRSLQYDDSSGTIISAATDQRVVVYQLCNDQTRFRISGLGTSTRNVCVGYTNQIPGVGVSVIAPILFPAQFETEITVPAGKYLCVIYHEQYNTGMSFQKIVEKTAIQLIAETNEQIETVREAAVQISDPIEISVTELSYLQYDQTTQKIVSTTVDERKAGYFYSEKDTKFIVSGLGTSTRNVCVGYTDVIPANGITVNNPQLFSEQFETEITVPAGKYLCVIYHWRYNTGMSFQKIEMTTAVEIANQALEQAEQLDSEFRDIEDSLTFLLQFEPTRATNLWYDGTKFISGNSDRIATYKLFSEETTVEITGTLADTTRPAYLGIMSSPPALDASMTNTIVVDTIGAFHIRITVPAGKYFCFAFHQTYVTNIKYYARQPYDFSEINTAGKFYDIYDDRILDVEYSAIGIYPNTIYFYSQAYAAGFRAFKADMRLTSDNKIILCHDAGFTFDGNGRIIAFDADNNTKIHDLTFAQVKALEFATQTPGGEYIHPGTLDDFLAFCKQKICVPYLTFRNEYVADTVNALWDSLLKYKMESKIIINLFPVNSSIISELRTKQINWLICDTRPVGDSLTQAMIDNTNSYGCQYLCLYREQENSITESLLRYASEKNVRIWIWGWPDDPAQSMANGITGFQNYSLTPFA